MKKGILSKRKGFTLVEVIVVLVVLAILAAILIPSMIGWIEKSKTARVVTDARVFYDAVQTVAIEEYAAGYAYSPDASLKTTYESVTNTLKRPTNANRRVQKIYDLMDASSLPEFYAIALVKNGEVQCMRYKDVESGIVVEWRAENDSWERIEVEEGADWVGTDYTKHVSDKRIWWNGYRPS